MLMSNLCVKPVRYSLSKAFWSIRLSVSEDYAANNIAFPLLCLNCNNILLDSLRSLPFLVRIFQVLCLMSSPAVTITIISTKIQRIVRIIINNQTKSAQSPSLPPLSPFRFLSSLCLIIILLMLPQGQEKRLVQEYKSTNRQLRRQLQNLNTEIDRIIAFKTNRIGLKKLPAVDKNLLQTQDVKLLQVQVDNLRKRLELLHHDNDALKERSKVNHMARAKELQDLLATRQAERKALRKEHYWLDKNSKTLNTTDAIQQEMKLYDKIEQVNQELIRCRKMQADLQKEAEELKSYGEKKSSQIQQAVETHKGLANTIAASRIEMPVTHKSKAVSDEQWKGIKREFLQLKQSKQREQTALNQDNDRLRTEIRALQLRLKQKKSTLDNIRSLQIKRKQRNYSTLENSSIRKQESVRYRNRNNKYSTKT